MSLRTCTFPRNQHALGLREVHSKVIARYPVSNGIDISLKIVKIRGGVDGLVKKGMSSAYNDTLVAHHAFWESVEVLPCHGRKFSVVF